MKVALICRSDATGGAAVVTFRLMNALRRQGVDARMIVMEKLTDSQYVVPAASKWRAKSVFLAERLGIFLENGFDRKSLFAIDTASCGLPLHEHKFVREADVICLNWVNQGMLSLKGIEKIASLGTPIVWTMHDMWNMTGICHHAGYCHEYMSPAGICLSCRLLHDFGAFKGLATHTWKRKRDLYESVDIHFVAVSRWLADCARRSSLMRNADISVIPNAFPIGKDSSAAYPKGLKGDDRKKIIFGAARIDDPIKGHSTLVEATKILAEKYPDKASQLELVTFGNLKDPDALRGIAIKHTHLGKISPTEISDVYSEGCVVVSTSEWETLPGTLIEGQAWGCVPVALDHGGQSDIISHKETGYLVPWRDSKKENALGIAEGILWGLENRDAIMDAMRGSVIDKFSEEAVADSYIRLFKRLC